MSTDPNLPVVPEPKPQVVEVRVTSTSSERLPTVHDIHESEKQTQFSITKAASEVLNGVFSRNALILILFSAGLLLGGSWAQGKADEHLTKKVDAGVLPVAEALIRHIEDSKSVHAKQDRDALRQEGKMDKLDARMEQLINLWAASQGVHPPPAPPLVIPDGGTP